MLKIWGKLIYDNRIIEDEVSVSEIHSSYQENLKACITELCYKFDISTPYWLKSNVNEYNKRHKITPKTIEKAIIKTKMSIGEGKTIAEPLGASGIFPPMVVQMISVGESTGALDSMLNKIADFYDDEVDAAVAALTSLLEPAMMVFLGITVGGMVIAMYLPIFKMASVIG